MTTSQPETEPTALILGASRGLGLALAEDYLKRGWRVVATARGGDRTALHDLADRAGGRLEIERVEMTDPSEISALRARLEGSSLDLLFVNAGVANDPTETIGQVATETFVDVMVTNALAPMRAIEALQDLVPAGGVIGVMSSELASIANNTIGTWEVYRASKAALNTLMKSFAARHRGDPRALVLMAPGWIRTDMGGPGALFSVEENIPKVVDVLVGLAGTPGLRFVDYKGADVAW
jgi:NAD(P)-dependent dehydrogenase (short-subunit alcohol dehydrogenase family)